MNAKHLLFIVFGVLGTSNTWATEFIGPVIHVRDGDTFVMRTAQDRPLPVRLCGVDSPERGQPGYHEATAELAALLRDKTVRCLQVSTKAGTPCDRRSRSWSRDRIVAQCFVGSTDIAAHMIRKGAACDWPKYSGGYYHLSPNTCVRH